MGRGDLNLVCKLLIDINSMRLNFSMEYHLEYLFTDISYFNLECEPRPDPDAGPERS